MGTNGMRAFGAGGVLNTDDNLHLEFSAPLSMDVPTQGENAQALYRFRESLLPYVLPTKGDAARSAQIKKWDRYHRAGKTYALAHVLFLRGRHETPEFHRVMEELDRTVPNYTPLSFLKGEVQDLVAMTPALIRAEQFLLSGEMGDKSSLEISAVMVRIGEERAAVIFVDNRSRTIYGQKYIDARKEDLEGRVRIFAEDVLSSLRAAYQREAILAARNGRAYPPAPTTLQRMREIITSMAKEA
jgi:spermidine synthase